MTKHKTRMYINVLQKLVDSYNSTPHRSLGNIAPGNINSTNQGDVWAYQFLEPLKFKKIQRKPFQYKVGDLVRLSYNNTTFKRSFNQQFTKEIFKIKSRFRMQ